jgi:hypothetical protein
VGVIVALVTSGIATASSPSSADPYHGGPRTRDQACGVKVHVDPGTRVIVARESSRPVPFTVRVTAKKGWQGSVTLAVMGLPPTGTSALSPQTVTLSGSGAPQMASLLVSLGPRPDHHRYQLWAVARCGKDADLGGFRIEIARDSQSEALSIDPEEATLQPGDSTAFCLSGQRDPDRLIVDGLPPRTSWSFAKQRDGNGCLWLTVRTKLGTPVGDFPFTVTARNHHGPSATATATLHVISDAQPFTISGDVDEPLRPGEVRPVDVGFDNPNPFDLRLVNLSVVVSGVNGTYANACPAGANFVVVPFTGPAEVVVIPAHGTTSLSDAQVPPEFWPSLELADTNLPQNGCIGATLNLTYTGTAVRH